jgi:hypothetical protein
MKKYAGRFRDWRHFSHTWTGLPIHEAELEFAWWGQSPEERAAVIPAGSCCVFFRRQGHLWGIYREPWDPIQLVDDQLVAFMNDARLALPVRHAAAQMLYQYFTPIDSPQLTLELT